MIKKKWFIMFLIIMAALMLWACSSGNGTEQVLQDTPGKVSSEEQVSKSANDSGYMPGPSIVLGVKRSGYTYDRTYENPSGGSTVI